MVSVKFSRFFRPFYLHLIFGVMMLLAGFLAHEARGQDSSVAKIPGLSLWLRADEGVVTNGNGAVRQWLDQSTNHNHAGQANRVSMPTLVNGALNGHAILHFDGVTNYLEIPHSASLAATQELSIIAVIRVEDFSTLNGIMGKTASNLPAPFDFYINESGQMDFFRGNGAYYSGMMGSARIRPGHFAIVTLIARATDGSMYLNGEFNTNAVLSDRTADRGGTVRIGTRDDFEPWLNGDLAELIFFRRALSEAERSTVERGLGDKYGLEVVDDIKITMQPTMQRLEGQPATFAVTAAASSPVTLFQWQRNGRDIEGATNSSYTTPTLTLGDNNTAYRVHVFTAETNRLSRETILLVAPDNEPLTISTAAFLLRDQSSASEGAVILPPYAPRLWPAGDDPARNLIQAIAQTPDGYLWLGTQDGLLRFDGEQFESIPIAEESTNLSVNALYADPTGALWAGARQGLFQRQKDHWKKIPLPAGADNIILSLHGEGGTLWVGTKAGLYLCQNEKLSPAGDDSKAPPGLSRSLTTEAIRCLTAARGGVLAGAGENVIALSDGQPRTNYAFHSFLPGFIRTVCSARDGSLWVGGNSGLIRFKDGQYTHYSKATGLPDNTVTSVYEDRRGNLWVGTYGGLYRFADGKFVQETTPEGEEFDQILCFFEDREDNLWVGAKNGLYQLRVQQFITYTTRHGLAHNNVISVLEDTEGALWIGTWGGGLHRLQGGKIAIYSATKNRAMENDLVLAIADAANGGIWFGEDYNGGLYQWHDGEIHPAGRKEGLPRNAIRALLEQPPGRLWIGTSLKGLSVLENHKVRNYGVEQGLQGKAIHCIVPAYNGGVWVGTEAGVGLWTNGGFAFFSKTNGLSGNSVTSLYEDPAQNLWVGTGWGLCRMKRENSAFHVSRYPFFGELVLEIIEDDFENLWLGTFRGILRVSKKELEDFDAGRIAKVNFVTFDKNDGMASQVGSGVAQPSACKSRDGRLWFATTKGLAVTDPKLKIARNEKPPPVVIESLVADKKPLAGNFTAPPGRGELEFRYTALSYSAPEKNRFKYKLEGWETNWVEAGNRHTAYYNNTPPGDYTFHVIACNNDGVWNETGAGIRFSLRPHFWQTGWFESFAALASLSLVAMGARYVTRKRLAHKLERLEQLNAVEKERARIARDMHDDLGAGLTGVLLLAEKGQIDGSRENLVQNNRELAASVRELAQNLDALVWAENPRHDTLARLVSYVTEYAVKFLGKSSIRCRLDVPVDLPDVSASSELRHNVYLIFKEALNNVAKYAHATEVGIRVTAHDSHLDFSMEDNGLGFAIDDTRAFGNGLINMRKRAEAIGGTFEITSQSGKGTQIRLRVPLRK